jgi:hypothetical protein
MQVAVSKDRHTSWLGSEVDSKPCLLQLMGLEVPAVVSAKDFDVVEREGLKAVPRV